MKKKSCVYSAKYCIYNRRLIVERIAELKKEYTSKEICYMLNISHATFQKVTQGEDCTLTYFAVKNLFDKLDIPLHGNVAFSVPDAKNAYCEDGNVRYFNVDEYNIGINYDNEENNGMIERIIRRKKTLDADVITTTIVKNKGILKNTLFPANEKIIRIYVESYLERRK